MYSFYMSTQGKVAGRCFGSCEVYVDNYVILDTSSFLVTWLTSGGNEISANSCENQSSWSFWLQYFVPSCLTSNIPDVTFKSLFNPSRFHHQTCLLKIFSVFLNYLKQMDVELSGPPLTHTRAGADPWFVVRGAERDFVDITHRRCIGDENLDHKIRGQERGSPH